MAKRMKPPYWLYAILLGIATLSAGPFGFLVGVMVIGGTEAYIYWENRRRSK